MFRKVNVNVNKTKLNSSRFTEDSEPGLLNTRPINTEKDSYLLNLKEDAKTENTDIYLKSEFNIDLIKSEIDKKYKKLSRGIQIKEGDKEDKIYLPFKKEETRESSIKKIFVSESQIKEARNPEEKKKLLGVKREELDRIKEQKKKGLIEMQKELFTLPENLQVQPMTKNDHVENLIKLSAAGLIEVPLPLEDKLKNIEDTENVKKQMIDNRLADELNYLKVLKKIQPSYSKSYKSDISSKKLAKLNNVFENVFVPEKSRRKKLARERLIQENRKIEEGNFK
jgi:hypothetical protein